RRRPARSRGWLRSARVGVWCSWHVSPSLASVTGPRGRRRRRGTGSRRRRRRARAILGLRHDDEAERRRLAGRELRAVGVAAADRDDDAVVVDVRRAVLVPLGIVVGREVVDLAVLLLVRAELVTPVAQDVALVGIARVQIEQTRVRRV